MDVDQYSNTHSVKLSECPLTRTVAIPPCTCRSEVHNSFSVLIGWRRRDLQNNINACLTDTEIDNAKLLTRST